MNLEILCNENVNITINDDVYNTYNRIEKHPPSLFVEKAFYLPHQMIHKLVLVYSYIYQCHLFSQDKYKYIAEQSSVAAPGTYFFLQH